jgi:hypothetical protein
MAFQRFIQRPTGATRAAQVVPVHSAHTASMIAQASRVPRLAKLSVSPPAKVASASRGKSGKR